MGRKFNRKKQKIIDILYLERSGEIYEENYRDEYQFMERDRIRLTEIISKFLKENMSKTKFEIMRGYLESLEEKNTAINTVLNKRFYGAGFCDGIKM